MSPSGRRDREITVDNIVLAAKELLVEGRDMSLRAVAARVGVTAPALYRYIDGYEELTDLVAADLAATTTTTFLEGASRYPDDPAGQLVSVAVAFRGWALNHRSEYAVSFANPFPQHGFIANGGTYASGPVSSSPVFNEMVLQLWRRYDFKLPTLDERARRAVSSLELPKFESDSGIDPDTRAALSWVLMRSWAALHGVVTLETYGQLHPALVNDAAIFVEVVLEWADRLTADGAKEHIREVLEIELKRHDEGRRD